MILKNISFIKINFFLAKCFVHTYYFWEQTPTQLLIQNSKRMTIAYHRNYLITSVCLGSLGT